MAPNAGTASPSLARALRLESAGDLGGALTEISAVLERGPAPAPAWLAVGRLLAVAGNYPDAAAALRRAAALSPGDASLRPLEAELWERAGALAAARAALRRAVRRHPRDERLWLLMGNLEARMERPGPAAAALRRALALAPRSAEARVRLGEALERAGRPSEAAAALRQAASRPRPSREQRAKLSELSLRAGAPREALRFAAGLGEDDWKVLMCRGAAHALLHRWDRAAADLDRAAALSSSARRNMDYEVYVWRAEVRRRLGERDKALSDLAQTDGYDAVAGMINAVLLSLDAGDGEWESRWDALRDAAGERWARSAPRRPKPEALRRLLEKRLASMGGRRDAVLLTRKNLLRRVCSQAQRGLYEGSPAKTLAVFGRLLRKYGRDPQVYLFRGEIRLWTGDYEGALADILEAMRRQGPENPRNMYVPWARVGAMAACALLGRFDEAERWGALAAESGWKRSVTIHVWHAELHRLRGDFARALPFYEEAQRLDPSRPGVWIGLALCRMALGEPGKAAPWIEALQTKAGPLFAAAASALALEPKGLGDGGPGTLVAVLERCLALMKGNRSSFLPFFVLAGGELRFLDSRALNGAR